MMLTIDTGTTNTRVCLWDAGGHPMAAASSGTGVRDTAVDGNNSRLREAVRGCLAHCVEEAGVSFEELEGIYASGMITSNVGLCEVPHLVAPAGIDDFVQGVHSELLPDVCPVPIHFIPGVKNRDGAVELDRVEEMDIMRGEEVESLALLDALPKGISYLFVLPGSHTKFVSTDSGGRLTGCLTSIAGELLAALSQHSILADAVGHSFVTRESYRLEYLLAGYRTAAASSFGRAAFSTRIVSPFVDSDPAAAASFLFGAVLQGDVQAVRASRALSVGRETRVVVSGKEPLCTAIIDLMREDGYFASVERFIPPEGMSLSGLGTLAVARRAAAR